MVTGQFESHNLIIASQELYYTLSLSSLLLPSLLLPLPLRLQKNLQSYDRDILQELWRIRSNVHEIRDSQQRQLKEESKYLSTGSLSDTASELSVSSSSLKRNISLGDQHSLSPSPDSLLHLKTSQLSTGSVNIVPPVHLQKESDDQLLADFFGSEQVVKLNEFKKTFIGQDDSSTAAGGDIIEITTSAPPPELPFTTRTNLGISSNPVLRSAPNLAKRSDDTVPLRVNGNGGKNRPPSDVVSEMQKLRLRLQATALQELADFDKQFSPLLVSQPSSGFPTGGEGKAGHTRQWSLDYTAKGNRYWQSSDHLAPPQMYGGHARQNSLPIDPNAVVANANYGMDRTSLTSGAVQHPPRTRSPTSYDSHSLERTRSPSSRSPTPPHPYGHARQSSLGSASSGSGTFSPPPPGTGYSQQPHPLQQSYGRETSGKPQLHQQRQAAYRFSPPPPTGKPPPPPVKRSGGAPKVPNPGRSSGTQSLPKKPSLLNGGSTHYSTTVVGRSKRHGRLPPARSVEGVPGYPLGQGVPMESPFYDRLGPGVDQPEIKHIPRAGQPRFTPSPQGSEPSPRPSARREMLPNSYHSNMHPKQGHPSDAHADGMLRDSSAPVFPADIQPYMTTAEARSSVKQFKYTPFNKKTGRNDSNSGRKSDKINQLAEQTWC